MFRLVATQGGKSWPQDWPTGRGKELRVRRTKRSASGMASEARMSVAPSLQRAIIHRRSSSVATPARPAYASDSAGPSRRRRSADPAMSPLCGGALRLPGDHGLHWSRRGRLTLVSSARTGQSRHRISGPRIAPMTCFWHDPIIIFQTRSKPCLFAVRAERDIAQDSDQRSPTRTRILDATNLRWRYHHRCCDSAGVPDAFPEGLQECRPGAFPIRTG